MRRESTRHVVFGIAVFVIFVLCGLWIVEANAEVINPKYSTTVNSQNPTPMPGTYTGQDFGTVTFIADRVIGRTAAVGGEATTARARAGHTYTITGLYVNSKGIRKVQCTIDDISAWYFVANGYATVSLADVPESHIETTTSHKPARDRDLNVSGWTISKTDNAPLMNKERAIVGQLMSGTKVKVINARYYADANKNVAYIFYPTTQQYFYMYCDDLYKSKD